MNVCDMYTLSSVVLSQYLTNPAHLQLMKMKGLRDNKNDAKSLIDTYVLKHDIDYRGDISSYPYMPYATSPIYPRTPATSPHSHPGAHTHDHHLRSPTPHPGEETTQQHANMSQQYSRLQHAHDTTTRHYHMRTRHSNLRPATRRLHEAVTRGG